MTRKMVCAWLALVCGGTAESAECTGGYTVPPGSDVTIQDDKAMIAVPEAYTIWEVHGGLRQKAELVCNCTEGSGCNPGYYQGSVSCVLTAGCTKCDGHKSQVILQDTRAVGFVDLVDGAGPPQDLAAFEDVMTLDWVASEVRDFLDQVAQSAASAPDGERHFAVFEAYGHLASVEVPEGLNFADFGVTAPLVWKSPIQCDCKSGTTGCERKSKIALGVHWCDAGSCASCGMSYATTDGVVLPF